VAHRLMELRLAGVAPDDPLVEEVHLLVEDRHAQRELATVTRTEQCDSTAAASSGRPARAGGTGQLDREGGPLARAARRAQRAAVRCDDPRRDVEAETEAAEVLHRDAALEAAEEPLALLVGDADPAVADHHPRLSVRRVDRDLDRAPRAELHRVVEEVRDDDLELGPAAVDEDGRVRVEPQLAAGSRERALEDR